MTDQAKLKKVIESGDIEEQLGAFEALAKNYLVSANWQNDIDRLGYLRASGIYNYCINYIYKNELSRKKDGNLQDYYYNEVIKYRNTLCSIEERFLRDIEVEDEEIISFTHQIHPIDWDSYNQSSYNKTWDKHIDALKEIRDKTQKALKRHKDIYKEKIEAESEKELYKADSIINIHRDSVEEIKSLVKMFFIEGENVLGKAPTDYVVIGFASVARGEMTPYSDPDCGILIKENSEEIKDYFRKLAYFVALKVVNIGETVLPILAIKELNNKDDWWFKDHATPFGFAFDSLKPESNKWPLGNMHVEGVKIEDRYELIGTPEEISEYIKRYNKNLYLSSVLSNIAPIYASSEEASDKLVVEYRSLVDSKLSENDRKLIGEKLLKDDIERFPPVDIGAEKIVFNAKQGIYRFIESIVEAICFYYGIVSGTTFQKISNLKANEVIDLSAEKNLKVILSIAMEIRLGAYIANRGKVEDIAVFRNLGSKLAESIPEVFKVSNDELERYFFTSIPLYKSIKAFLKDKTIPLLLKSNHLYDGGLDTLAIIEHQLMNYGKAYTYLHAMDALFISNEEEYDSIVRYLLDSSIKVKIPIKDLLNPQNVQECQILLPLITIPYNRDGHFVDRTSPGQSVNDVIDKLEEKKIVVLDGVGGGGKTALSIELGHQWAKKNGGENRAVWWFDPDYELKFNEQMRKLCKALCVKIAGQEIINEVMHISPEVIEKINEKLKECGKEILLIFDNYHSADKSYRKSNVADNIMIKEHSREESKNSGILDFNTISIMRQWLNNLQIKNVKVLISNRGGELEDNYESFKIKLEQFNKKDIEKYFREYNIKISDDDFEVIISEFSNLPLQLSYIVNYFKDDPTNTVKDLKRAIEEDPCIIVPDTVTPFIVSLNEEEKDFLMRISYLGTKSIPFEVYETIIKKHNIKPSFLVKFDSDRKTLDIHEETSKMVRFYAKCKKKEESIIQGIGGKFLEIFKGAKSQYNSINIFEAAYQFCSYVAQSKPFVKDYKFSSSNSWFANKWECKDLDSNLLANHGKSYYYGRNGVKQDYDKALLWFNNTVDHDNNNDEAKYYLGLIYKYHKQQYKEALKFFEDAASLGSVEAMYNLAIMYEKGEGEKKNLKKSAEWYTRAVNQGSVNAQYILGMKYKLGDEVVNQSHTTALSLLKKAALQNHIEAQYQLGNMSYESGISYENNTLLRVYFFLIVGFKMLSVMFLSETCHTKGYTKLYTASLVSIFVEIFIFDRLFPSPQPYYDSAFTWYTMAIKNGHKEALKSVLNMSKSSLCKIDSPNLPYYINLAEKEEPSLFTLVIHSIYEELKEKEKKELEKKYYHRYGYSYSPSLFLDLFKGIIYFIYDHLWISLPTFIVSTKLLIPYEPLFRIVKFSFILFSPLLLCASLNLIGSKIYKFFAKNQTIDEIDEINSVDLLDVIRSSLANSIKSNFILDELIKNNQSIKLLTLVIDNLFGDVNVPISKNQYSPLIVAIESGSIRLVEFIINKGAEIDYLVPINGNTALHFAVLRGAYDIIHLLLEKNANSEIANSENCTALDIAIYQKDYKVACYMISQHTRFLQTDPGKVNEIILSECDAYSNQHSSNTWEIVRVVFSIINAVFPVSTHNVTEVRWAGNYYATRDNHKFVIYPDYKGKEKGYDIILSNFTCNLGDIIDLSNIEGVLSSTDLNFERTNIGSKEILEVSDINHYFKILIAEGEEADLENQCFIFGDHSKFSADIEKSEL